MARGTSFFRRKQAEARPRNERRRDGHSRRLGYEPLEDRQMLALVVPTLNSLPGAAHTLFLDFDGAASFNWTNNGGTVVDVHGPANNDDPIPAFTIDNNAADFSSDELQAINDLWAYAAEKYSIFDVNVTTVDPGVYNENQTARVIIGGRDADWNNQSFGGIASVGGFFRTDRDNTSFVFSRDAIDFDATFEDSELMFLGETIAHEAAHTFVLDHQRHITSASPMVIDEYYNGNGVFAPIMGDASVTRQSNPAVKGIWWQTGIFGQNAPDPFIDELNALIGVIGTRTDDHDFPGGNPTLMSNDNQGHLSGAGVIGHALDQDAFRFLASSTTVSFTVSNAANGGMLSPRADLRTYPGNQVVPTSTTAAADGNSVTVSASNLTIGQFYVLNVTSDFRYSSLGQYTIAGTQQTFATLNNGVLTVNGFDNVNDDIQFDLYFLDPTMLYVDDAINGNPSQVAAFLFPWSDVNSIVINTGSGNDNVRFLRSLPLAETTLNMGAGVDTVDVRGYNTSESIVIQPTYIDWGYQTVTYDNTVESIIARGYDGDDTFYLGSTAAAYTTIYGGLGGDTVNVSGVSATPAGLQHTIYLEEGNDTVNIASRDGSGNFTINGNLGIGGGTGNDKVVIQDSSSLPNYYTFYNQFGPGTTNIGGLGAGGFGAGSDVEDIILNAGNGADTFNVASYKSVSKLRVNAGGGNDDFFLGAGNLATDLVDQFRPVFDGQLGADQLYVNNSSNPAGFTYENNAGAIAIYDTATGSADFYPNDISVETLVFNGGPQTDLFYIHATNPGQRVIANAGAGLDGLILGQFAGTLENIRGPVEYLAGVDGGNMGVQDWTDTTGDTLHLTQTSLGAYPGDNLFGPGGSLTFSDLVNFGANPGIGLLLGDGFDTIYAQPLATARVTIDGGGNPIVGPGDILKLQLALAGAQNSVVSNPSTPSGQVTSGNLQTLSWTGIEQPVMVLKPGDFNQDGATDGSDLAAWRGAFGVSPAGDGDGDGVTDGADFLAWQRNLGSQSASPASVPLAAASLVADDAETPSLSNALANAVSPHGSLRRLAMEGVVLGQKTVHHRSTGDFDEVFSQEIGFLTADKSRIQAASRHAIEYAQTRRSDGRPLSELRPMIRSAFETRVDDRLAVLNEEPDPSLRDLDLAYAEFGSSL